MAQSIAQHAEDTETGQAGERIRVSFDLVVTDPQLLWHAAARIALQQPGMTIADVEDVLGPAEDPILADCLAMLTAPDAIAGCAALGFTVSATAGPQRTHLRERTVRARAVRDFVAAHGTVTKQ